MKKLAIIFFGVFALATSAKAAVYDFVGAAASLGEGGYASLVLGDLVATGTFGGAAGFAYLDGPSGGFPGGLGVCDALNGGDGSACTNASNDSVSVSQADVLSIDVSSGGNEIKGFTFNPGGEHGPVDAAFLAMSVDYSVNGGTTWATSTFGAVSAAVAALGVLTLDLRQSASGGSEFYVAALTTVPVPAAVWLFGTAMLGLFGMRRKAKMGAVAA